VDDKTALIDTVDVSFGDVFIFLICWTKRGERVFYTAWAQDAARLLAESLLAGVGLARFT
jgi:hypothetical protein